MIQTVSILGCGWLGQPLGEQLLSPNTEVRGSTTRPEKLAWLAEAGIQPFLLHFRPLLPPEHLPELDTFLACELLIIAIPPQVEKQGEDFHPAQIEQLTSRLKDSPVKKIIYISSTSVYPEANREVNESEPLTGHNGTSRAILRAEQLVQDSGKNWIILRCGGLMGYNRIPGKYVAGRKGLTTGDVPVNFVHRDDVTGIIQEILQHPRWNQTYNVVAPEYPVRRDIYARNAREFGYSLPEYADGAAENYKVVNGSKLLRDLKYTFKYPNPLDFTYTP
jgi:nucleoside-diphosphate-sugar epimerase